MLNVDFSTETIVPVTSYYDKQTKLLIVNAENMVRFTEMICTDENCRYPQLTLRILVHIIAEIDRDNKLYVNARELSGRFDVHYDTVTKCLKYLRSINVLRPKNNVTIRG